jgi:hypothetical protein
MDEETTAAANTTTATRTPRCHKTSPTSARTAAVVVGGRACQAAFTSYTHRK